MTRIEWSDQTWNPVTGCTKVSYGCDHCYAETITERFHGKGSFAEVTLHPERLDAPLRWRRPRRVFVNSMSDLFHADVPDGFIGSVFDVMAQTPRHTYQILTKRPGRMRSLLNRWAANGWHWRRADGLWCGPADGPLPNVHLGVSVEDQRRAELRIPVLLDTPSAVRFLSCEPLLGPVRVDAFHSADGHRPGTSVPCELWPTGISWVIVGGESGPGARRLDLAWARSLVEQCRRAHVPVFVKQMGSVWAQETGWGGKGGLPEQWPADLRVREFPAVTS